MRSLGGEQEEFQVLQVWMRNNAFDEPLAQPQAPIGLQSKNITEPSKGSVIGNNACEPSLTMLLI